MALVKKILIKQIYHTYRKQGLIALFDYLIKSLIYILYRRFLGSYSQKGEDLMIDKLFKHKKKGFYIDVGAYHPQMNSNTKFFYEKGWNGINIEPNPSRIKLFLQSRKRDINLNLGIGTNKKKAVFYEFEATGLSTFSKREAESLIKIGYKLKGEIKVQVYRLEEIMKKYAKVGVDFMSVDTEGLDLEVLKSNDWEKYRPKILCIETIDFIDLLTSIKKNASREKAINEYLLSKGYRPYSNNGLNTVYMDSKKI